MKKRYGFVSNSSSSSFMIGRPKGSVTKIILEVEVDDCDVISTEDELWDYFVNELYEEEDEIEDNERYQEALKVIKAGKEVVYFTASNEDQNILSGLYGHTLVQKMLPKDHVIIDNGDW